MSRITVKPAGADRRVPVEKMKGVYFEHGIEREVHHTRYIKRRLKAGDLIKVEAKAAATPAPATTPQPTPLPVAPTTGAATAAKGE